MINQTISPRHTITPCLWFDTQAEEAVNFYISVFKNSGIEKVTLYGENGMMPKGTVLTISFKIHGQEFIALNGGPVFKFSPAVSFIVNCQTQAEIDDYWSKLIKGGEEQQCGWVKDKFGMSWQIVPVIIGEMLADTDKNKSARVMTALLKMKKINIQKLQDAYDFE